MMSWSKSFYKFEIRSTCLIQLSTSTTLDEMLSKKPHDCFIVFDLVSCSCQILKSKNLYSFKIIFEDNTNLTLGFFFKIKKCKFNVKRMCNIKTKSIISSYNS